MGLILAVSYLSMTLYMQQSTGSSFASFGEITQGRLSNGEDFLVTLPVNLWSRCHLSWTPIQGHSVIQMPDAEHDKAHTVAEQLLTRLNRNVGVRVNLRFSRDMPVGKGLSSSTADMLAVVRAFQQVFDFTLSETEVSHLFAQVEPHDALHYDSCVAYNHRNGRLLKHLGYIPDFCIVGVDSGGRLSTLDYNRNLNFSSDQLRAYDQLYAELLVAFAQRSDAAIAGCASRSAELHCERIANKLLPALLNQSDELRALGVIATHSGTCAGLMLAGDSAAEEVNAVADKLSGLGRVFVVRTCC